MPENEDSDPSRLPLDDVFDVLKNERRRITIRYLGGRDDPAELGDLAEHVALRESDGDRVTSTMRKRAYVGLYQCHLPKMDELGVVEFDRDRGLVDRGPNFDQVEAYLDGPDEPEPWPQYYLALAGVNVVLFAGWLAAGTLLGDELSTLGTAVVGLVVILSFVGLALVHHRRWTDGESEATRSGN